MIRLAAFKIERFVGTWKLVSFETRTEDGTVSYPFGKNALGYIMYSIDGYMSVALLPKKRRKFKTQDILGGTIEDKVAAAESFISYFGRYKVRGKKVIHLVEISFFPNWVGVDQERSFRFDENKLILSAKPMLINGKSQSVNLIWEKI